MTMTIDEELPPSRLGTQAHWDEVYEREVRVFKDIGDEGEIWFGESSVTKMRGWAQKHLTHSSSSSSNTPLKILECGSGNGTLLLSFLTSPPDSTPSSFHLTGIDYSPLAAHLASGVESARRLSLEEDVQEENWTVNDVPPVDWRTGDLLRDDMDETWDLVLDKGTFDALCLSNEPVDGDGRLPSLVYPEKVATLVQQGGFFLITSCNFTEEEIKKRWTRKELGFVFHSSVPHPSFTFGGKAGSTVCTVAFQRLAKPSIPTSNGIAVPAKIDGDANMSQPNGTSTDPLFICIDCGGTKTDIAIASASEGIVARAIGGTGNMAEVGLQLSYEIICATTRDAINNLPEKYRQILEEGDTCPVHFADVWVGISGCDTPWDQSRMSNLLGPFFGLNNVPILNDAHLLGGALLKHHCPWGVAVIAGTGSVVVALEVDDDGMVVQTGRRGGVGYLLGDDGSAFDLGRCAIRVAVDEFDCGLEVQGGLASAIQEHFRVQETGEVLAKVYDLDPTLSPSDSTNERKLRISALSRPILTAFTADPPDPLAVRAVHDAAAPLISSIVSIVRQHTRHSHDSADSNLNSNLNSNADSTPSRKSTSNTLSSRQRKVEEAALMMGGGVIRQESYMNVVLDGLKKEGIVFGVKETVGDVAGEGVMGLVERARGRERPRGA